MKISARQKESSDEAEGLPLKFHVSLLPLLNIHINLSGAILPTVHLSNNG
jgi:hypothetical protein